MFTCLLLPCPALPCPDVRGDKGKEKVQEDRHTSLALHSIQLKNFGPFRDEVCAHIGVVGVASSGLKEHGLYGWGGREKRDVFSSSFRQTW